MTDPQATLARTLIALLDLTSLNDDDTDARIIDLCQRAMTPVGPVAAVCVYPRFVALARRTLNDLGGQTVAVATVVNFPAGNAPLDEVLEQTRQALADGADEIDVVYPYRALLAGDADSGFALVRACKALCADRALLKVILETGELAAPALIRQASLDAIEAGADFIKTSTGKVQQLDMQPPHMWLEYLCQVSRRSSSAAAIRVGFIRFGFSDGRVGARSYRSWSKCEQPFAGFVPTRYRFCTETNEPALPRPVEPSRLRNPHPHSSTCPRTSYVSGTTRT